MNNLFKLIIGSSGKSEVKSSDLINQFPKSLNLLNLCSQALKKTDPGTPIQAISKFGPLELNLDFFSGESGFQISWMLEQGEENLEISKGQILQFEISRPGKEPLKMTYDPSKNYNLGNFPLIQHLPLNASLNVTLIDKPSSEQEDQNNRSVGQELSKRAA